MVDRLEEFFGEVPQEVVEVVDVKDLGFDSEEVYATLEVRFASTGNKYQGTFMYSDADGYAQWYVNPEFCQLGLIKASAKWANAGNENCVSSYSLSPFEDWDYLVGYFRDDVSGPIEEALAPLLEGHEFGKDEISFSD